MINFQLEPDESLEISVAIQIQSTNKTNHVEVFVFRFYSETCGFFGEPLIATVEVLPEQSQEDLFKELVEGENTNPILYEIAQDFVDEGLGTFEQCLDSLIKAKSNYEDARRDLVKKNKF